MDFIVSCTNYIGCVYCLISLSLLILAKVAGLLRLPVLFHLSRFGPPAGLIRLIGLLLLLLLLLRTSVGCLGYLLLLLLGVVLLLLILVLTSSE